MEEHKAHELWLQARTAGSPWAGESLAAGAIQTLVPPKAVRQQNRGGVDSGDGHTLTPARLGEIASALHEPQRGVLLTVQSRLRLLNALRIIATRVSYRRLESHATQEQVKDDYDAALMASVLKVVDAAQQDSDDWVRAFARLLFDCRVSYEAGNARDVPTGIGDGRRNSTPAVQDLTCGVVEVAAAVRAVRSVALSNAALPDVAPLEAPYTLFVSSDPRLGVLRPDMGAAKGADVSSSEAHASSPSVSSSTVPDYEFRVRARGDVLLPGLLTASDRTRPFEVDFVALRRRMGHGLRHQQALGGSGGIGRAAALSGGTISTGRGGGGFPRIRPGPTLAPPSSGGGVAALPRTAAQLQARMAAASAKYAEHAQQKQQHRQSHALVLDMAAAAEAEQQQQHQQQRRRPIKSKPPKRTNFANAVVDTSTATSVSGDHKRQKMQVDGSLVAEAAAAAAAVEAGANTASAATLPTHQPSSRQSQQQQRDSSEIQKLLSEDNALTRTGRELVERFLRGDTSIPTQGQIFEANAQIITPGSEPVIEVALNKDVRYNAENATTVEETVVFEMTYATKSYRKLRRRRTIAA